MLLLLVISRLFLVVLIVGFLCLVLWFGLIRLLLLHSFFCVGNMILVVSVVLLRERLASCDSSLKVSDLSPQLVHLVVSLAQLLG